jgi:hypothetical protein
MFAIGWVVIPSFYENQVATKVHMLAIFFVARKATMTFLIMFFCSFYNYRQEYFTKP